MKDLKLLFQFMANILEVGCLRIWNHKDGSYHDPALVAEAMLPGLGMGRVLGINQFAAKEDTMGLELAIFPTRENISVTAEGDQSLV